MRGVHHSSRELKAHFGFLNPPVPAAAAYYKDVVYVRAERKDSPREEYQSILAALEPMVAGCKRKLASFKRIVTARSIATWLRVLEPLRVWSFEVARRKIGKHRFLWPLEYYCQPAADN